MKGGRTMKGTMRVMGPEGDSPVEWDTEVQETVDAAKQRFAELLLAGHVGFVTSTGKAERIEEFNPEAGRIVVVMPMIGG